MRAKLYRGVTFNINGGRKGKLTSLGDISMSVLLSGGWEIRMRWGSALGYLDAKYFARCLMSRLGSAAQVYTVHEDRQSHPLSFCVRGKVPLAEAKASNRCGCTAVVLCGVQMKVPEKIFASVFLAANFTSASGVIFSADAVNALLWWAKFSVESIDARRAGDANAWSCWCNRHQHNRWWVSDTSPLQMKEEWDWTFHCLRSALENHRQEFHMYCLPGNFSFEDDRVDCGDGCDKFKLIARMNADKDLYSRQGFWMDGAYGPGCLFPEDAKFEEQRAKIYEDFLSDLGLALLTCRCRYGARGFEIRLRWFASVNPEHEPRRGFPHCQLQDSFLFYDMESNILHRTIIEPSPLLFAQTNKSIGTFVCRRLDPQAMDNEMFLTRHQGHSRDPHMKRQSHVAKEVSMSKKVCDSNASRDLPVAVSIFESPDRVVQLTHDPNRCNRVALGTSHGRVFVFEDLIVEWQSDYRHEDIFGAVEALAWCGEFLLSCGSEGLLGIFRPGPGLMVSPCALIPVQGLGSTGADSYIPGKPVVQCVAACSSLVACAAGRAVSVMTVIVDKQTQKLAFSNLTTLLPLASTVIALEMSTELLAAATLAGGCVLWTQPATQKVATPPDIHLICEASCLGLHIFDQFVIAGCNDSTIRVWQQDHETCFTLGGLHARSPKCCACRSASSPDSIILVISDGERGVLLWPLNNDIPGTLLGLNSRRSLRIANRNGFGAINVAASEAKIFVIYNDGSLNTFLLDTNHYGISATCLFTYTADFYWHAAIISSPKEDRCPIVFAVCEDRPMTKFFAYSQRNSKDPAGQPR